MSQTSLDIKEPGLNSLPPGVERYVVEGGGLTGIQILPDDEIEIINNEGNQICEISVFNKDGKSELAILGLKEIKDNSEKIIQEVKSLDLELNPNIKISLYSKTIKNSFINNYDNNNGRVSFFGNIENNHVKIYFAPVDIPKIFPNSEVFSPDCINSGGTIHEGNKAHIILFRKEESDKVLVHELIHYLKLDFSMSNVYWGNINGINNRVVSEFNVTPSHQYINLFEALTDTLAIVFNSMCNCIITKSDINDYFYTELIYSRTIAGNILKHSGFRNVSDLMDTNKTNKLKQSTSVLLIIY